MPQTISMRVKVNHVSMETLAEAGWEIGDGGVGERSLTEEQERDDTLHHLTKRQREVAQILADGYTRREVADRLGICLQAVHQIVLRMRKRLQQVRTSNLP